MPSPLAAHPVRRRRRPPLVLLAGALTLAGAAAADPDAPAPLSWERLTARVLEPTVEEHCLALNVYHEARGEPVAGMLAVAAVTLNRARHPGFPDRVCEVVWQAGQFSWTHDGRSDQPADRPAWRKALALARFALTAPEEARRLSLVGRSVYFHAAWVRPAWAAVLRKVARVGSHIFYEPAES